MLAGYARKLLGFLLVGTMWLASHEGCDVSGAYLGALPGYAYYGYEPYDSFDFGFDYVEYDYGYTDYYYYDYGYYDYYYW